jgi:hypothetical protein
MIFTNIPIYLYSYIFICVFIYTYIHMFIHIHLQYVGDIMHSVYGAGWSTNLGTKDETDEGDDMDSDNRYIYICIFIYL